MVDCTVALPVYIILVISTRRLLYSETSLLYAANGQGTLTLTLAEELLARLVKVAFVGGPLRTLTTRLLVLFRSMNLLLTEH